MTRSSRSCPNACTSSVWGRPRGDRRPEVAREDGAQLVGPGHPALDRAADDVLERGDAGWGHLAWPGRSRPAISTLQERARERFPVAHGRVDLATPLSPWYAPLLRVGGLASYTLSLDERVQERLEVWVDARTGRRLDARVGPIVRACPLLAAPDAPYPRLEAMPAAAAASAHAALEDLAAARLAARARDATRARAEERARAEAYFAAALDALARRRAAAPQDRLAALDGQAEATLAERARRLHEIDETYRPSVEVRPFRLHLVWAPALRVPVRVRRGAAAHDLALVWLLAPLSAFAPLPCPACTADQPLVAGRARLGCRACAG